MTHTSVHLQCVELLLTSMTSEMGSDGRRASFMFGPPGNHWGGNVGMTVYYHDHGSVLAALYLRGHGPAYLRSLSLDEVSTLLHRFVVDNYWYLFNEVSFRPFDGTYADRVSAATKQQLAQLIADSAIFTPINELSLYPLVPLRVEHDFDSETFSLVNPPSLNSSRLPAGVEESWIEPTQFPVLAEWSGRKEHPSAWLCVRSPNVAHSDKLKAAILGAISLTLGHRYRHLFSGRGNFGGRCTISDGISTTFMDPHMPPLMHDIVIDERDQPWLTLLSEKLNSSETQDRRSLRALEYFYRAWPLSNSERFPILCMSLDAVFGDVSQATQAVIDAVRTLIGPHISMDRLRLLMKLRASVIHGGAPDVYDSSKYTKYYSDYGVDPIRDMERLVARCLQLSIFGDIFRIQDDPNAALLQRLKEEGKLAPQFEQPNILDS